MAFWRNCALAILPVGVIGNVEGFSRLTGHDERLMLTRLQE
jgi:hypothetical protein